MNRYNLSRIVLTLIPDCNFGEEMMTDREIIDNTNDTWPVIDRALLFGEGVYEVLRLCNGHLFAYQEHMSRLAYSLAALGLDKKIEICDIAARVEKAIAETSLKDAVIYFQISRQVNYRSFEVPDQWTPQFYLTINPLPKRQYEYIKTISTEDIRWKRCDIKSLNLLGNVLAKEKAIKAGCHDALFVNQDGYITESTSASVMMIKDKVLYTASLNENILPSVTRKKVLEIVETTDLIIAEMSFTVEMALSGDELFLCGTTTEIMPIIALDHQRIADGLKGHYSTMLHHCLVELMYDQKDNKEI